MNQQQTYNAVSAAIQQLSSDSETSERVDFDLDALAALVDGTSVAGDTEYGSMKVGDYILQFERTGWVQMGHQYSGMGQWSIIE